MKTELPEGWKEVKLGDICEVKKGNSITKDKVGKGNVPVIAGGQQPAYYHNQSNRTGETITVSGSGAFAGFVAYFDIPLFASDCSTVQSKDKDVSTKYIYYFLKSQQKNIYDLQKGIAQPHVYPKDLARLNIPIPRLEIQKKIVAVLEKAQEVRTLRIEANKLSIEFLKSIFIDMFGDPIINPKNYPLVALENLFSEEKEGTKCGPFGSALKKEEYVDSGVAVWNMDNILDNVFVPEGCLFITEKKYHELASYSVEEGDIIISRAGTVGKMCVVHPPSEKSIISTNLIRLSLNKNRILPIYFTSLMTFCKGRVGRLKTGADGAYTFMNTGVLKGLKIPLPPIEIQKKFFSIMKEVEHLEEEQARSKKQIDRLFNVLAQKAFKGELTC